jgi:thiol-disulfide isomerase/thioredoxin
MPRRLRHCWWAITLAILLVALPAAAEIRTWTDVSGKHTVEAEFVSLAAGNVKLRRPDGQEVTLPVDRLSSADRAYVKGQASASSTNPKTTGSRRQSPAKPAAGDATLKAIRDTVERFYRDLRTTERSDARSLLTEAAQKYASDKNSPLLKIATPDDGARSIRIGRARLSESQAEVPVQVQVQNQRHETTLHLRQEGDAWRVFGISTTVGEDEFTLNFEDEPAPDAPEKSPDPLLALVGQPFRLQGVMLDGTPFDISQYEGKVVLVDFWATWCGPCRKEMPNILANYQQYQEKGFEVVAVSIDKDLNELRTFLFSENPPWTVLADRHPRNPTSMAKAYSIRGIPAFILVGRDGKVAAVQCRGKRLGAELEKLLGGKS